MHVSLQFKDFTTKIEEVAGPSKRKNDDIKTANKMKKQCLEEQKRNQSPDLTVNPKTQRSYKNENSRYEKKSKSMYVVSLLNNWAKAE